MLAFSSEHSRALARPVVRLAGGFVRHCYAVRQSRAKQERSQDTTRRSRTNPGNAGRNLTKSRASTADEPGRIAGPVEVACSSCRKRSGGSWFPTWCLPVIGYLLPIVNFRITDYRLPIAAHQFIGYRSFFQNYPRIAGYRLLVLITASCFQVTDYR